jgi:tetratricopeptide (TPR) repeat protein
MPDLHRAASIVLAAFLLVQAAVPAVSAPVTRSTINQVSELILKSYDLLNKKEFEAARTECEKAQALEQKFEADPFISATVNVCFGDVEDYEENTDEACKRYDEALKEFRETPARHPAQRVLKNQIKAVEGKRAYLSCGA